MKKDKSKKDISNETIEDDKEEQIKLTLLETLSPVVES